LVRDVSDDHAAVINDRHFRGIPSSDHHQLGCPESDIAISLSLKQDLQIRDIDSERFPWNGFVCGTVRAQSNHEHPCLLHGPCRLASEE